MERKIVELLIAGVGVNQMAKNLRVSKRRIRTLREMAVAYGYLSEEGFMSNTPLPPYPEPLFPDPQDKRAIKTSPQFDLLEPHKGWIEERLKAGWHAVTVFEELPQEAQHVTRSAFYRFLSRHQLNRLGQDSSRVVPEIVHQAGEALLVDWGKLCEAQEPVTLKKKTVWIFTGILGYSRYLMVRLVWSNDVKTTLGVLESMFREIGGVPRRLTSDNPKCFALKASPYEPLLNPAYERFVAHYGTLIECLPPADPAKKGKVERPIPYVRRLYEAHGPAWQEMQEAQDYLDKKLIIANQRKHGTTLRRPGEVFLQEEKSALKPLPALSYEMEDYHEGIVRQDGHVRFDNKYYSLNEEWKGKTVSVLGTSKTVALYYQGKLLDVHPRITDPNQSKSTKTQHLKPWERSLQDHSLYRSRAAKLGPAVDQMILILLTQGHGFIDTRKVWGILSLDKTYPAERINRACTQAMELGLLGYRAVRSLLEAEDDQQAAKVDAVHSSGGVKMATPHQYVRDIEEYERMLPLFSDQNLRNKEDINI